MNALIGGVLAGAALLFLELSSDATTALPIAFMRRPVVGGLGEERPDADALALGLVPQDRVVTSASWDARRGCHS